MTDEELVDDIKNFVFAGTDTASNFLVALIFLVFEHPEVAARLRKEIESIVKSNEDITIDNIKKMTYLECVFLETSRRFSVTGGLLTR